MRKVTLAMDSVGRKDIVMDVAIVDAINNSTNFVNLIQVIRLPHPMANPYQQARDNLRGERMAQNLIMNLGPPNLYYDHGNAKHTFHPPASLHTTNGDIPLHSRLVGPQPNDNRKQGPHKDPGPSNFQDVGFMDVRTDSHPDESIPCPINTCREK